MQQRDRQVRAKVEQEEIGKGKEEKGDGRKFEYLLLKFSDVE